jgi:hypothetical protein
MAGMISGGAVPSRDAQLPLMACFFIGVVAAVLGLVPWLLTGMRLPVHDLWLVGSAPPEMPVVLLPFSQYALTLLASLLITGGAVSGIAARATRGRLPERGFVAVLLGMLLVQAVAVVQTSLVVRAGLQERPESVMYLTALIALAVVSVAVAVLVMALVSRAPRAGGLIGLAVAALMIAPWLSGLVVPFGSLPDPGVMTALSAVRWVPPVLIGAAVAWAGIGSVGRIVAATATLLALWLVPALLTAVTSAAGSRVLAPHPAEMLEYAGEVFTAAATMPGLVIRPLVAAVAVAVVGLLARAVLPALITGMTGSGSSGPGPNEPEEVGTPR